MTNPGQDAAATREGIGADLGILLALVLATLAVYSGVSANGFVSFDDPLYITKNPHVASGLSFENIRWAFSTIHSDNWHPVTWLSHMLDSQLFGLQPAGHHAVSVAIHALNTVLLFLFLRGTTGKRWPSLFVAAFFALHPLRVESVAWASERKDVLSSLFFFSTLLAYVRYVKAPGIGRLAIVFVLFALGLLAKPMLVTLPLILLLVDYWPLARSNRLVPPRPSVVEKLPLFALAATSAAITLYAQSGRHTMQTLETIPLLDRIANAMVSGVVYLVQSVWPADLAVFYPHPSVVDAGWPISLPLAGLVSAVALSGVTAFVVKNARTHRHLFVGWLWYLICLAPVIGIVQVGGQAHADRYTYLPTIGIAIGLCFEAHERLGKRARYAAVAAGVALVFLGLASHRQVATWRDSISLYQHAHHATVNNYIAANNMGADLAEQGGVRAALRNYAAAIAMHPEYAAAHSNLGIALERAGQYEAALASYREALRIDPDIAPAHVNLASLMAKQGDLTSAIEHYERAAELRPGRVAILLHLADNYHRDGQHEEAITTFERALAVEPDSAELHTRVASVHLSIDQEERARMHLRTALAREPGLVPAAERLSLILSTSNDPRMRDGQEAVRLARICTRTTRNLDPRFLQTLAAAHAELGDFDQAVRSQERAAALTPIDERERVLQQIERYREGAPLRLAPGATP
jgi:tetratricopeptide (TPR) repeat protein